MKHLIPQSPAALNHPPAPQEPRRGGCRHRLSPWQGAVLIDEIIVLISDLYLFCPACKVTNVLPAADETKRDADWSVSRRPDNELD